MINYLRNRKLAFYIALLYVGFGTLSVCSVYPADPFYGEWSLLGLLITFPVSIISFGYRYANPNFLYPVFIIQTIMLIMTFLILTVLIKIKKNLKFCTAIELYLYAPKLIIIII